jgi:hypothetical protein
MGPADIELRLKLDYVGPATGGGAGRTAAGYGAIPDGDLSASETAEAGAVQCNSNPSGLSTDGGLCRSERLAGAIPAVSPESDLRP